MPAHTLDFDAILFDMDGTLINSTPAVNANWKQFAEKHNIDLEEMLTSSHGVQCHMTFRKYLPSMPEEDLQALVKAFEGNIIPLAAALMAKGKEGLTVLPGVTRLLNELRQVDAKSEAEGKEGFGIVTSSTKYYGLPALEMLSSGIGKLPKVIVTANDVPKGKPNPDPYLEGARLMGVDPNRCLVVEDAPSGAIAGLAAGCKVLGVGTGHDAAALRAANPDYFVNDLSSVSVAWKDGKVQVTIIESD